MNFSEKKVTVFSHLFIYKTFTINIWNLLNFFVFFYCLDTWKGQKTDLNASTRKEVIKILRSRGGNVGFQHASKV